MPPAPTFRQQLGAPAAAPPGQPCGTSRCIPSAQRATTGSPPRHPYGTVPHSTRSGSDSGSSARSSRSQVDTASTGKRGRGSAARRRASAGACAGPPRRRSSPTPSRNTRGSRLLMEQSMESSSHDHLDPAGRGEPRREEAIQLRLSELLTEITRFAFPHRSVPNTPQKRTSEVRVRFGHPNLRCEPPRPFPRRARGSRLRYLRGTGVGLEQRAVRFCDWFGEPLPGLDASGAREAVN
jgi:hypothetical protein